MSQYLEMSDCEPAHSQSHKAWMTIGHAAKLGHSVRFHCRPTPVACDADRSNCRLACVCLFLVDDTGRFTPFSDMNSERWRLDAHSSGLRNRAFWQIFLQDTWLVGISVLVVYRVFKRVSTELWFRQATNN